MLSMAMRVLPTHVGASIGGAARPPWSSSKRAGSSILGREPYLVSHQAQSTTQRFHLFWQESSSYHSFTILGQK